MTNVVKNRFFTTGNLNISMLQKQVIGDSELMLTAKGAIYHLDLRPEQIADTIITVGDPDRVQAVSKYFDRIEHKAKHREFVTHTGYVGNKKLSVISTGIGPDNIDIVLNELDALANIDFDSRTVREEKKVLSFIRLGTCGGLMEEIEPGSMIASSHAIGLDNLMHYYRYSNTPDEIYILNEFLKHTSLSGSNIQPYVVEGSIGLRKHFSENYVHGITVTCPGFYGPQGRVLRAPVAYPNLIDALCTFKSGMHRIANFEMETSAIYGISRLLGHQCISISTTLNNRLKKKVAENIPQQVEDLIKYSLEIIEKI
jgi:uridine phosphorylase